MCFLLKCWRTPSIHGVTPRKKMTAPMTTTHEGTLLNDQMNSLCGLASALQVMPIRPAPTTSAQTAS